MTWIRQNPAFTVTLGYLLVSAFGAALEAITCWRLGFNYFHYVQPSDLFLSALRRPSALFAALVTLGIMLAFHWPSEWVVNNPTRVRELRRKPFWAFVLHEKYGFGYVSRFGAARTRWVAVLSFFMSIAGSAIGNSMALAGNIKGGTSRVLMIEPAAGSPVALQFVAATSQFVIGYDPETQRVAAWPYGSVRQFAITERKPSE